MSIPNQTVYVDFSNRMIYKKKNLLTRLATKFHLYEIFLGAFALVDIYVFLIILFTFCQR